MSLKQQIRLRPRLQPRIPRRDRVKFKGRLGLRIKLPGRRSVSVTFGDDTLRQEPCFVLQFVNRGVVTRLALSQEAMAALSVIYQRMVLGENAKAVVMELVNRQWQIAEESGK